MTWTKTYDVATATANGQVACGQLREEIADDPDITTALEDPFVVCDVAADDAIVVFASQPTQAEEDACDAVVAAHTGEHAKGRLFHASSKLVADPVAITQDQSWQDLGFVRTTVGFFVDAANVSNAYGRMVGDCKVAGTGAELRLIRTSDNTATMTAQSIADTSGAWAALSLSTTADPSLDSDMYVLQGRLNGSTSFELRGVSMSLMEWT